MAIVVLETPVGRQVGFFAEAKVPFSWGSLFNEIKGIEKENLRKMTGMRFYWNRGATGIQFLNLFSSTADNNL